MSVMITSSGIVHRGETISVCQHSSGFQMEVSFDCDRHSLDLSIFVNTVDIQHGVHTKDRHTIEFDSRDLLEQFAERTQAASIDYRADGKLIAHQKIGEENGYNLYVVLVQNKRDELCVATYNEGMQERNQGTYFSSGYGEEGIQNHQMADAWKLFAERVQQGLSQ